ncbi:expressed unknown protein [Seminavis robusta]|uniref:Trichome birefringence-like C-terminal domain-containing protein n=1 Tax=Seminavis robusta TaxID=568900 RepID=A0A9N8EVR6_9STRA|nr:expressed unknown protein [Seminavis robusta]|eukprot:Sro1829_g300270.1 n/a (584) ;mRNA; f:14093-15952
MSFRSFCRTVKLALLLLACLIVIEIDVDLQALRESVRRAQEQGIVEAFNNNNGTAIWRRRNTTIFSEQFAWSFQDLFVRHDDDNMLLVMDDDEFLQRDDMFVPEDENDNENIGTSHHETLLDVIASGTVGDFESVKSSEQKENAASDDLKQAESRQEPEEKLASTLEKNYEASSYTPSHRSIREKTRRLGERNEDIHSKGVDFLELTEWEEQSLQGLLSPNSPNNNPEDSCQPPNGISRTCCLGSFSSGGNVESSLRGQCRASMQNLGAVREHAKLFLQQHPVTDAATSTTNCDVCQIVEVALQHNLSIALIGDSMHNQVMDGLSCELERRNYQVTTEWIHHQNVPKNVPYMVHSQTRLIHIRSPLWEDAVVTIQYHQIYRLPLLDDSVMPKLTAQADVVVLGFGLHWWYGNTAGKGQQAMRREDNYVKYMSKLFRDVTKQGHVKLLVHRETSAQHFDARGGEYSLWNRQSILNRSGKCHPMDPQGDAYKWREKAVERAAAKAGRKLLVAGPDMPRFRQHDKQNELVVLPYFDFTSQHHGMHPRRKDKHGVDDCTHYCSSPFMYMPIWRSLRLAMDRQFPLQQ